MKTRLARRLFGAGGVPPTIGRYRIDSKVGAGGMGVVYEAYDPELERRVAIKLLHPDLDERHRIRLRREAQALARLSHPNVVHVYEIGEHDDALFLVMEFVAGLPLSKWQRGKSAWRGILPKYIEAGVGLAAAHAAGIVHRDFKPSNVVVVDDGPTRVLDFGLARSVSADGEGRGGSLPLSALETRVTLTGSAMGTPAYMSPEQMLGQPTDATSDQYSFCVALYEALYGERPFTGRRPAELYEALLFENVRPAPDGSTVPKWIRAALLRGLRARPEERHASMEALLRILNPPARSRRAAPFVVIGAAIAAAVTWSVAPTGQDCDEGSDGAVDVWTPDNRDKISEALTASTNREAASLVDGRLDAYVAAWTEAQADGCALGDLEARRRALSCLDERQRSLATLVGLLTTGRQAIAEQAAQLLDELPEIDDCLDEAPPTTATADDRVELIGARLDALTGDLDGATARATAVLDRARDSDNPATASRALLALAMIANEGNRHPEALTLLREAAVAALGAGADLLAAEAWLSAAEIAVIRQVEDGHARASEHVENAQAIFERVGFPGDSEPRLTLTRGLLELKEGRPAEAEVLLQSGAKGVAAALGPEHPKVAEALRAVGSAQLDQGKLQSAIESFDQGRLIIRASGGPSHPKLWHYEHNIAVVELALGDTDGAVVRLEGALALIDSRGPQYAEARARVQVGLTQALYRAQQFDRALAFAREARAIYSEIAPPASAPRRNAESLLAALLGASGQLGEAAEMWHEVAAGHAAAHDDRGAALAWAWLVFTELRRGRVADARAALLRHRQDIAAAFIERADALDRTVMAVADLQGGDVERGRETLDGVYTRLAAQEDNWCAFEGWVSMAIARSYGAESRAPARAAANRAYEHLKTCDTHQLREDAKQLVAELGG